MIATLREGRGTHFDPLLVEAFLDVMPEVERVRQEFAEMRAA